jgi:hypothetical protein
MICEFDMELSFLAAGPRLGILPQEQRCEDEDQPEHEAANAKHFEQVKEVSD